MEQRKEGSADSTQEEIDLAELFRYLKQKWLMVVSIVLAGAVLAGLITHFLIKPKYTATSKLYVVSASGKNIVNLDDLRLGTSLSSDYKELLKTRPICTEIIEDLDLDYSVGQLKQMFTVSAIEDTRMLTISVVSDDPQEAKDIANAVADKAVTYLPKLMGISAPNIAEEAVTPTYPTSPSMSKNVFLGAVLALAAVCGILTICFMMDDTVKTAEDIEKLAGVMPLTVILENEDTRKKSKGKQGRNS